jgi:hypothetical protein
MSLPVMKYWILIHRDIKDIDNFRLFVTKTQACIFIPVMVS